MAGRPRARGVAIALAVGAALVGLLGGVAAAPAAAQPMVPWRTVPTVNGVSPASGPIIGGTVVTITETVFTAGATVAFGANAATNVQFVNSTTLKATSPAGAALGKVDVTVTTAGGTSATSALDQFNYTGPTVTGVSPASGPAAGGTVVTISGTGYTAASTVKFGANAGTGVQFVSSTVLKATSSAGTG